MAFKEALTIRGESVCRLSQGDDTCARLENVDLENSDVLHMAAPW